ncbi:MAG: Omp28-related outer membrane protein [bacterium]
MKYINSTFLKAGGLVKIVLLVFVFLSINISAQVFRNPVLEYCTGTWCGSCACGHQIIHDDIIPNNPNAIIISYHGYATSSDPFAHFEGNGIIDSLNFVAYPTGIIDRTMLPAGISSCANIIGDRNRIPAYVGININSKFNPLDRNYSIKLSISPHTKINGEFYIQLVLTEDSIMFPQAGGGDCPGSDEFVFNNLCRKILNGVKGDLLPASENWMPEDTIHLNYNYLLPEEFNEINCNLTAIVYKKVNTLYNSEIQQAERVKLFTPIYKSLKFIAPNNLNSVIQINNSFKIKWEKDNTVQNVNLYLINREGDIVNNLLTNENNTEFLWQPDLSLQNNYYRLVLSSNNNPAIADTSYEVYLKQLNINWQKSNIDIPKSLNQIGYTVTVNNNYLYVIGGDSLGNGNGGTDNVYYSKINEDGSLDPFYLQTLLPNNFAYGSSFVYNDFIYLFGNGYNKNYKAKILNSGMLENWQELKSFPLSLVNVKAVLNGNRIYVLGLFTDSISTYVNRTYYSDIQPDGDITDWNYLAGVPNTHIGGEAAISDSVIYYIGGKGLLLGNYQTTNMVHYAKINWSGKFEMWTRSNFTANTNNHSGLLTINKTLFLAGGIDSNNIPLDCYQGEMNNKNISWFGTYNLPESTEYANMVFNNGYLYYLTGYGSNSIYFAKIDDSLTAVEENKNTPNDFVLYNNYPNPFNPSTIISFNIKENSDVSLKVYNILGKEISLLVKGNLQAGRHKYTFNGAGLSSGVYFYQINVAGKIKTGKMLMVK